MLFVNNKLFIYFICMVIFDLYSEKVKGTSMQSSMFWKKKCNL